MPCSYVEFVASRISSRARDLKDWTLILVLLFALALLPSERSFEVSDKDGLKTLANSMLAKNLPKFASCDVFEITERENALAVSIIVAESTFRKRLEEALESTLYYSAPALVRYLDLSIGPAQMKNKYYAHFPDLNPLNLCDALEILRSDITNDVDLLSIGSIKSYLRDYNGSSSRSIYGELYVAFVLHVFNRIAI